MLLSNVFDPFIRKSPLSVMARLTMERVLAAKNLNALLESVAERQYTRELLFSSVVELMSLVVCGTAKHVQAGFQRMKDDIPVSLKCLYEKLQRWEPKLSAELVRFSSQQCQSVLRELHGPTAHELPGYRLKVVDGNCLAGTQKRVKELRGHSAAALPGKTLVIFDPVWRLVLDVIPCEDGHAQERELIPQLVSQIEPRDVWVADRNFCVIDWLTELRDRAACFVIRHHAQVVRESQGEWSREIETRTGWVSERSAAVTRQGERQLDVRVIRVRLQNATRDGDGEIEILTNLPAEVADAARVAEIYCGRWAIETAFQELTVYLGCELNTLGYPKAALFGFCVAIMAYNIQSVVKGALRSVHGSAKIDEELSGYYVALEWVTVFGGMMIAIPASEWEALGTSPLVEFAAFMRELAEKVPLDRFKKRKRLPKKKPTPRIDDGVPHRSTAKVLRESRHKSPQ